MASASKEYLNGIYQHFSYLAAWLPNTTVRLGDVGILSHGAFTQTATLASLKIPFQVRKAGNKVNFTYTAQSGIALKTKAAGELAAGTVLPLGEAGVSMQFSKEGAFLFQAIGCTVTEIENKEQLGQQILDLYQAGQWNADWTVVNTLVQADSATIVISNSKAGSLDLTAKGPVALSGLANLDAGLTVAAQSGDVIYFLAEQGLSPLFKLARIKKPFLDGLLGGEPEITFGGAAAMAPGLGAKEGLGGGTGAGFAKAESAGTFAAHDEEVLEEVAPEE